MKSSKAYATLFIIAVLTALGCSSSSSAPKELQGVWKTASPESAGVSIEFKPDRIIISSDLGVAENAITKVERRKGHLHNSTLYTIYYSDRFKETNLMNVLYTPGEGGVIRFKSEQDVLWKKSG
jgi:hypothetical protein